MNEAKHTPGPWHLEEMGYNSSSYYIRGSSDSGDRLTIGKGAVAHIPRSTVNPMEANARLIAAAPEMLEALKWYENKAKEMGKAAIHSDSKRILELMQEIAVDYGKLAGAAIAKATGGADSVDGSQKGTP